MSYNLFYWNQAHAVLETGLKFYMFEISAVQKRKLKKILKPKQNSLYIIVYILF